MMKSNEQLNLIFSGKFDMAKGIFKVLICYIRKLRAFNFKRQTEAERAEVIQAVFNQLKESNQQLESFEHPWDFRNYSESIPLLLGGLLEAMLLNNRISLSKLCNLASVVKIASDRLHMKQQDEVLKNNELYQQNLYEIKNLLNDFQVKVNARTEDHKKI